MPRGGTLHPAEADIEFVEIGFVIEPIKARPHNRFVDLRGVDSQEAVKRLDPLPARQRGVHPDPVHGDQSIDAAVIGFIDPFQPLAPGSHIPLLVARFALRIRFEALM